MMKALMRLFLLLAAFAGLPTALGAADTRDPDDHFFNLNTGDLKAELADAKTAGKKAVLLMLEQEGCPACLYMKRNVLNRVDVQEFYRERFLIFTIDINGAVPLKDFYGRDLTEKRFARTLKVKATPTFVFFDLDGNEAVRVTGAVKEVADFLLLGHFVASGAYKSGTFAQYKRNNTTGKGS